MFTLNDLTKFDPTNLDFSNLDISKIDFPEFKLPKVEFPEIKVPKVEFPDVKLPEVDVDRVADLARDAAYVGVGMVVIGVQKADQYRRDISDAVTARVRQVSDTTV